MTSTAAAREQQVREAARENAEWCDAVCRSHGVPGEFHADAWTNPRRTPPFYPDAVTLTAAASAREVLARIDTSLPGDVSQAVVYLASEQPRYVTGSTTSSTPVRPPR